MSGNAVTVVRGTRKAGDDMPDVMAALRELAAAARYWDYARASHIDDLEGEAFERYQRAIDHLDEMARERFPEHVPVGEVGR